MESTSNVELPEPEPQVVEVTVETPLPSASADAWWLIKDEQFNSYMDSIELAEPVPTMLKHIAGYLNRVLPTVYDLAPNVKNMYLPIHGCEGIH